VRKHQLRSSWIPRSTSLAWSDEILRAEIFEAILEDLEWDPRSTNDAYASNLATSNRPSFRNE
jgi:hypothetical protein